MRRRPALAAKSARPRRCPRRFRGRSWQRKAAGQQASGVYTWKSSSFALRRGPEWLEPVYEKLGPIEKLKVKQTALLKSLIRADGCLGARGSFVGAGRGGEAASGPNLP